PDQALDRPPAGPAAVGIKGDDFARNAYLQRVLHGLRLVIVALVRLLDADVAAEESAMDADIGARPVEDVLRRGRAGDERGRDRQRSQTFIHDYPREALMFWSNLLPPRE